MISFKSSIALIFFIALFFWSCKEDEELFIPNSSDPSPLNPIEVDVSGRVSKEDGSPLKGVTVIIEEKQVTTDRNGFFVMYNAHAIEERALLNISKNGYFSSGYLFSGNEEEISFFPVVLLPKNSQGVIDATSGGEVAIGNGSSLKFDNQTLVTESGELYEGKVEVYGNSFDPSDPSFDLKLPGSLRGLNRENEEIGLMPFSIVAFELASETGIELSISGLKVIELKFSVPDDIQQGAPNTLPLWKWEPDTGFWVETGSAKKTEGGYRANVTQPGFWSVQEPFRTLNLSGTMVNEMNAPIMRQKVRLRQERNGVNTTIGYGYTSSNGEFRMKGRRGVPMKIELLNFCGEVVQSVSIGATEGSIEISKIVMRENSTSQITNLNGQLIGCALQPLQNTYLNVLTDEGSFMMVPQLDGNFNWTYLGCSPSGEFNLEALSFGEESEISAAFILPNENIVQAGKLMICEEEVSFCSFEIDEQEFLLEELKGGFEDNHTVIYSSLDSVNTNYFYLKTPGISTGSFPVMESINGPLLALNSFTNIAETDVEVTFTSYGENEDEFVTGSVSGTFQEPNGTEHRVSGSFRFIRSW